MTVSDYVGFRQTGEKKKKKERMKLSGWNREGERKKQRVENGKGSVYVVKSFCL